jgi:hypothetical protein
MKMEIKDIVTAGGIVLTFAVGVTSLIIGIINSKKTIFINSVTSSRIKWIDVIRDTISEFCGLTYHYSLTHLELEQKDKNQLREKVDKLRFLIKLQLNRNDKFDKIIIDKIDTIIALTDESSSELKLEIEDLIVLTQDLLKLEWEGVKEETKRGNLSRKFKKRLYEKHLRIEKEYL